MGVCYNVLLEVRYDGGLWQADIYFDLGKTYELASCFPHRGWPASERGFREYDVSKVARAFYEHEFADTGLAWGTLAEVEELYVEEMKKPHAHNYPTCRAIFAAGHVLRDAGADVRLLLWSD